MRSNRMQTEKIKFLIRDKHQTLITIIISFQESCSSPNNIDTSKQTRKDEKAYYIYQMSKLYTGCAPGAGAESKTVV